MIKTLALAMILAACAVAQTQNTVTYTSPVGAIKCSHVSPYQEWYQNLVENSTPPYPNALQPGNFFMPAFPNHPIPVANGGCPVMGGFVSPDGLHTANLQTTWFRIDGNVEAVEINNIQWTLPATYPAEGEAVTISMDANVVQVCAATCSSASGTFHLEGQWAFQWVTVVTGGCRTCGRWNNIEKSWSNTSSVVVTINDQSTVAILD